MAMGDLGTNVVAPAYEHLADASDSLVETIERGCASGDLTGVPTALDALADAWLATASFRSGPMSAIRLGNAVSYPIDAGKVSDAAASVVDPTDVSNLGSDSRGIDAIRLVLASSDATSSCPYLTGAAWRISAAARGLTEVWAGDDGHTTSMATEMGSQDAVELIISDLRAVVDDLVFFRFAAAADGTGLIDPDRAQPDARALVASIDAAWTAYGDGGLGSLVSLVAADTDEVVRADIAAMRDAVETGDLSAALAPAQDLRTRLATEVATNLAATLLLGDADGDA